jgi:hypothetical protein
VAPEIGGVAGIYDQSKLKPQMKTALTTLAGFIETTVGDNAVPMKRTG